MPELHERNGKSYTRKSGRSMNRTAVQAATINRSVGDGGEALCNAAAADSRRRSLDADKFRELKGSLARCEDRTDQRTFGAKQSHRDIGEQAAGAIDDDMLIVSTPDFIEESETQASAFAFACRSDTVSDEANAIEPARKQLRGEQCEGSIAQHRHECVALSGDRTRQSTRATGGEREHGVFARDVIGNDAEL